MLTNRKLRQCIIATVSLCWGTAAFAADMPAPVVKAPPPEPSVWTYTVTPYAWLPSLNGSTTVKGRTADIDATFIDLLHRKIPKELFGLMGAMYVIEVIAGGPGSLISGPSAQTLVDLGASVALAQDAQGNLIGIAVGQNWRLITAIFLHAGILHIAFNAYALWIFGRVVEDELGTLRFLLIFFVTGFVWPLEGVPKPVQAVGYIFPSNFAIDGIVRIGQLGASLWEVAHDWLGLWILALAYFALAAISAALVKRRQAHG